MSSISRRAFFELSAAGAATAAGAARAQTPATGLSPLTRDAQPISAAEHAARMSRPEAAGFTVAG
jgi:hypothetical protein